MNKKKLLLIILLVFLGSLLLSVTIAKYYTRIAATADAVYSASWHFEANGSTKQFTTNLGDLYPGINCSFDINLSSIGSEVPINYTITFYNPVNIPSKLIFYKDFFKQQVINLDGGTITGTLDANTTKVVTVYYDWASDSLGDAEVGTASFGISIVGRQQSPGA